MGRSIIWIFLFIILFPLLLRGNNELSVSEDIGIRINKDTVTYLCDNFMLDRYLTLADMLSEMPGFSVEEDGSVKALGQPLTKIILEGTGYFFDDIALTVNNFPVSFIDKLVVFDRTTMRETDLGVADLDAPEKKMNIILKKEALEKFRGIANLGGGAVTSGDRFLYEGGLLIQRNEKGRNLTFLAKADNNMELKSQSTVLDIEPGDEGVLRIFESGMNYSIPKVGNHKYKFAGTYKSFLSEAERTATRQTFTQAISPILAKMAYNDTYDKDLLEIKAEINKADRSKFYYEMTPSFIYSGVEADSYMDVHTEQDAMKQKSFKGKTFLNSQSFRHENNIYAYFKHLRNSRRILLFNFRYYFEKGGSDKKEYSDLFDETDGIDDLLNLYYKGNSKDYGFDSYITYVEPLGKY